MSGRVQYAAIPFLYVYARRQGEEEVDDELTTQMEEIFAEEKINRGVKGFPPNTKQFRIRWGNITPFDEGVGFMGIHMCICGAKSTSNDYLIFGRYVTNSLCVHYLRYHRSECTEADLKTVHDIIDLRKSGKTPSRLLFPKSR